MTSFRLVFCIGLLLIAVGCSTTLRVYEVPEPSDRSTTACGRENACGIPFRVKEAHTIRVFRKSGEATDGTPKYKEVFVSWEVLPSQRKLYSLNYNSDYFSNHDVKFNLNGDSTLKSVDVSETIVVDAAIRGIGENAAASLEAALAFDETELAKEIEFLERESKRQESIRNLRTGPGERAEEKLQEREAAVIAALESLNTVNAAQVAVDELEDDATSEAVQAAFDALRLAKLRANVAHRRAGIEEPFPGVFP